MVRWRFLPHGWHSWQGGRRGGLVGEGSGTCEQGMQERALWMHQQAYGTRGVASELLLATGVVGTGMWWCSMFDRMPNWMPNWMPGIWCLAGRQGSVWRAAVVLLMVRVDAADAGLRE
jgi:hypothetical protein